jgi:transposase-like protein
LLGREKSVRREPGSKPVYRNGYGKPRQLALSNGTVTVRRPRVRGLEDRFESRVLPLFRRRTQEVGELLPRLYLHGLALGDFELALRGLLGEGAPLSKASIARSRAVWELEFQEWRTRSLADLDIVYTWADGLYVKAGIDDGKAALLVILGATRDGEKVVLAVDSGQRESRESWARVLRDLKARGLAVPRLLVADGHLGIWAALAEIWPECDEQRCWNHKMVNVLDQVPLKRQPAVREHLRAMMYAETRAACEKARDKCIKQFQRLYPKAMAALQRDWDRMVTFL